MVEKCKNCGNDIIRFPLRDREGKFLWKNLFKISWDSIILIIIIITMILAYQHDTGVCMEIIEDPVRFCDESNACKVLEERLKTFVDPSGINVLDPNIID